MKEQFLNLTGLTELVGYLKTSIANHKEILPYASNKLFPSVGDINTIYINTATNTIYRWDSSSKTYITLAKAVKSVAISEATENGKITLTVDGNKTTVPIHGLGSAAYTNSSAYSPAGHTHTKAQVGLGNVDNTADANKSVKHATTADSATTAGTATNVSAGEGTADAARHVWFSDSATETKRAYSDKFKYNPVTNNLTVNVTGNAATASSVAWGNVTGKPSTYAPSAHNHDDSTITSLNASKLFGTIDIARLPHGALERCVIVADDTARFALTTAKIQLGDTVKVNKTQKMYFVIDDSKLNSEAGYTVYTAGSATSVPWSGVTGKPTSYPPSSHTHAYLPLSGGTMTGALNFANGIWNVVGDDVAIGDMNVSGTLGVMGKNGNTGIKLVQYGASTTGGAAAPGVTWTCTGNGTSTMSGTLSGTFSGNLSGTASKATQTKAMEEIQLNDTSITTYLDTTANIHRSTEQGELNLYRFFAINDESNYSKTYGLPAVDNHALVFSIDRANRYNRIIDLDIRSTEIYTKAKVNGSWSDWIRILTSANYSQYVIPLTGSVVSNPNASNFSVSKAMTGNLLFSNTGDTNGNALGIGGVNGANDGWAIRGYQTSQNRGCLEIAVGDDGDEGIYVRQYTSGQYKLPFMNKAGSASGLTYREIVLMEPGTGNSIFPGTVTATTFKGSLSGNADSATKATKDSDNQQINTTYIKGLSVSGKTITYTKGNGTTGTITTQDTVYSHPSTSGNKHIPAGGSSGQILRWSADGTATWGSDNNTTYSTGTASASGITKLYTGTGSATDGTMTQSAITSALNGKSPTSHTHNYAGSSSAGGAANSANKLATARTINGTSFDGSGNITTSSWGTARNVTVGGTTKSVNGSGNVSWSMDEIGIHLSTTEPAASDGKNGDIWITYE